MEAIFFLLIINLRNEAMAEEQKTTTEPEALAIKDQRNEFIANKTKLKELVDLLVADKLTRKELAQKLNIPTEKIFNDAVFMAAMRATGNTTFIDNLLPDDRGRQKTDPTYVEKRGILITSRHFKDLNITDKQKYSFEFDNKTKVITLRPKTDKPASDKKK